MTCDELMFSDDGSNTVARCIRPWGEEHSHHDMQPQWYIDNDLAEPYEGPIFADSPLRAAAPDLLAALERIAASEPRPRRDGTYDADVVESFQRTARAAIRKATGP